MAVYESQTAPDRALRKNSRGRLDYSIHEASTVYQHARLLRDCIFLRWDVPRRGHPQALDSAWQRAVSIEPQRGRGSLADDGPAGMTYGLSVQIWMTDPPAGGRGFNIIIIALAEHIAGMGRIGQTSSFFSIRHATFA